jgi:hypothetical protein
MVRIYIFDGMLLHKIKGKVLECDKHALLKNLMQLKFKEPGALEISTYKENPTIKLHRQFYPELS